MPGQQSSVPVAVPITKDDVLQRYEGTGTVFIFFGKRLCFKKEDDGFCLLRLEEFSFDNDI